MLANVFKNISKYELINISTGPEGDHFTDFLNVLFFYLLATLYGTKIILTVRNIAPYSKTATGIFSYIRNKAIQKIYRITFETHSMRQEFIDRAVAPQARLGVIYFRFSDTSPDILNTRPPTVIKQCIKIGLLGAVDTQRRNYEILIDSLSGLPWRLREQIEIVVLGKCSGTEAKAIICRLRLYVRVIQIDALLSEKALTFNGVSCDVLLAPLRTDKSYGTLKGTGAVADAIYLRRPLILPSAVDTKQEFKDFCYYYDTASDLIGLFQSIGESGITLKPDVYEKYMTGNVLDSLLKDLKLSSTATQH